MSTKVLVVETTEGIADMLNFSRTADYDVINVSDAQNALDVLSDTRFHLVISDIDVPDMDGIEFLCYIKKHYPTTEVIMISDIENRAVGLQSLKYEASDFLLRPVTSDALDIVIERAKHNIAIRKKLTLAPDDVTDSDSAYNERLAQAEQLLTFLDSADYSGIISIHSPDGNILKTSEIYNERIGDMTGKMSWEMYSGDASTKTTCPVSIAVAKMQQHHQKAVIKSRDGDEFEASIYTAPVMSPENEIDFVIEVINPDN